MKKNPLYQTKIPEIGFLVSIMSHLNLNQETEKELLETYYAGLEQNMKDEFTSEHIIVKNKPQLFKLLNKQHLRVIPIKTIDKFKRKKR